jgi:F-type H+-transporting ATPase subunit b
VIIEWFTVIAQIINFLILLLLMRRFLYRPILNAMDERERKITQRLRDAQESIQEADETAARYHRLQSELEQNREKMLQSARQDAEDKRQALMREARQEVERAQAAWNRAVRQEKEALMEDLNLRASRQMIEIARRALADLANKDLEEHIIRVFLDKLKEIDETQKADISGSFQSDKEDLLIRTAFELDTAHKERIRAAVREIAGMDGDLRFEIEPGLLGGIELKTKKHKVAWSLDSYMQSLEKSLAEALREKEHLEIQPEQSGLDVQERT